MENLGLVDGGDFVEVGSWKSKSSFCKLTPKAEELYRALEAEGYFVNRSDSSNGQDRAKE
jgi:hypothetical protein